MCVFTHQGIKMSEPDYGKYSIVHGEVRLEDPTHGQHERDAYVAKVIDLANGKLIGTGCDELWPLKIIPARADDDYFHFLHIGSMMLEGGGDGAFHFELQRSNPQPAEEVVARLVKAARFYLERRDEVLCAAADVYEELSQYEWPAEFEIIEVAALMDDVGEPRFSAELSMLDFNLVSSRSRRIGRDTRDLLKSLERAAAMHEQRLAALVKIRDAGCDLFVEETAQHLLEHYNLSVERVLEVLQGTHWMDIFDERDDAIYSAATLHIQDGTLVADMRNDKSTWELRGNTFVLGKAVPLPETTRIALIGQPLSKLLRTGNMLENLEIVSLGSEVHEVQYIELKIAKAPFCCRQPAFSRRAA
ncbi:MAG: hypothetical protein COW16_06165 [Sphingomonadales bacterium CG12_big_fil_rev_8_21_14_0_65_65_10]|nr:MAG: hypothetical protein COW16_06165 [Sphingomonadales bacterium CG12_big_fil_rev_8_21_14_0_65_65_10]